MIKGHFIGLLLLLCSCSHFVTWIDQHEEQSRQADMRQIKKAEQKKCCRCQPTDNALTLEEKDDEEKNCTGN